MNYLGKAKIFIVSGRAIESLKKLIGIDDLYYIGVHGHVIRGPDIEYTHSALTELEGIVKSIRDRILEIISGVGKIAVEDKGIALSIHYRGAGKERSKKILEQISKICSEYYGIRLMRGKKILEILPNTGWDKGKAIDFVLAVLSSRTGLSTNNTIPIYFGDDRTDEYGFKVLRGRGVSVRVGYKCNTNAEYYVNNTDDVIRFLNELKHKIARSSS